MMTQASSEHRFVLELKVIWHLLLKIIEDDFSYEIDAMN